MKILKVITEFCSSCNKSTAFVVLQIQHSPDLTVKMCYACFRAKVRALPELKEKV